MTSNPPPDSKATARFALAVLTMRANTPGGEWLPADYERHYLDGYRELRDEQGEDTDEYLFLDMLNIAWHLLFYLETATGRPISVWLGDIRDDYVEASDA